MIRHIRRGIVMLQLFQQSEVIKAENGLLHIVNFQQIVMGLLYSFAVGEGVTMRKIGRDYCEAGRRMFCKILVLRISRAAG